MPDLFREVTVLAPQRLLNLRAQAFPRQPQEEIRLGQRFWQPRRTEDELGERQAHIVHGAGPQGTRRRTQPAVGFTAIGEFGQQVRHLSG